MASLLSSALVATTLPKALGALGRLDAKQPVYLDTETTGLNVRRNKLVCIQMFQEGWDKALILDWRLLPINERGFLKATLSEFLPTALLVGHNIKFDVNVLHYNGIDTGKVYDTLVAQKVLTGMGSQEGVSFGLAELVLEYHGIPMSKAERTWFYKPRPLDERPDEWNAPLPEEEVGYCAMDVTCLPKIHREQVRKLGPETTGLGRIFQMESRVLPALVELEQTGMRIDMVGWRAFIAEKAAEAERLEAQLLEAVALPILTARIEEYDAAREELAGWEASLQMFEEGLRTNWETFHQDEPWGEYKKTKMAEYREEFPRPATPKQDHSIPNVNSQDQMVGALLALKIPVPQKRNKHGDWVYTLDSKRLAPVADQFPILGTMDRQRKAVKFVDAFGESLLEMAEPEDQQYGTLHPTVSSIGAATGRTSMSGPNLQQVPSQGDGSRLRALVQAPPGHKLVVCDFSNIEWRIMAAMTQDPTAIAWLSQGLDMHEEVARRIWPDVEDVRDKERSPVPGVSPRQVAKSINYGLLYGMTEHRLSRIIKQDVSVAKGILDGYFAALPAVRQWLDAQAKEVLDPRSPRYLKSFTLMGRVRVYPAPLTRKDEGRVQRQACNHPIQGSNADMTKLAVMYYHEAPRHGKLIGIIHDELCLEVPDRWAEGEKTLLEDKMDLAQWSLLKKLLPREALPRPEAKISDHWEH